MKQKVCSSQKTKEKKEHTKYNLKNTTTTDNPKINMDQSVQSKWFVDHDATTDVINLPHSIGTTIIGVTYHSGGADSRTSTGVIEANKGMHEGLIGTEVRQRAAADAQEKIAKASSNKNYAKSKFGAERAAVDRATTAEARRQALAKAMSWKTSYGDLVPDTSNVQRNTMELYAANGEELIKLKQLPQRRRLLSGAT
ncbi:dnaJ domain-containing protein [Artemisia annua]|uniref:DnaJ domain-containing protein n=1 Tax=Artemisia annua TaxID=35608 RepID=A0A2U1N4Z4_ARTAN|nr:dnaJ domain-containing protein [Artemisia annua]